MSARLALVLTLAAVAPAAAGNPYKERAEYNIALMKSAGSVEERVRAIQQVGEVGLVKSAYVRSAVTELVGYLKDGDKRVRVAAAVALGRTDPDPAEALGPLKSLLKDDDLDIRVAAARGLAAMGKRARPALGDLRAAMADAQSKLDPENRNTPEQRALDRYRDAERAITSARWGGGK